MKGASSIGKANSEPYFFLCEARLNFKGKAKVCREMMQYGAIKSYVYEKNQKWKERFKERIA
ncbi:MAG: hypothetical protein NNA31_07020 [Nitrospira sp.]|nr:hypothetical protein [Nitrospira sp.]